MSKFADWTDEELDQLAEAIDVCYGEGIGPAARDMERELIEELESRNLELPWWVIELQRGEPLDAEG